MHAFVTGNFTIITIVNMIVFVFTVYKKFALFFIYMHIHILKTILFLLLLLEKKDIG